MPVTKVGIVYYADDPEKKVFRIIYPTFDDKELDEHPTDQSGKKFLDENDQPHTWVTLGVDPERTAVMEKVTLDDLRIRLDGVI